MVSVIVAAILLLQTFAPADYQAVSQFPIQGVYGSNLPGNGWTFCGDKTLYVNLTVDSDPIRIAGTLAHEASHLQDYPYGCGPAREAKAMRATLRVYRLIGASLWRQEWATKWYWTFWRQEHPGRWGLGLLP